MIELIKSHPVTSSLAAYYIFSSMVSALPTPSENGNKLYQFFFNFMHLLSANVLRIPQLRNFVGIKDAS